MILLEIKQQPHSSEAMKVQYSTVLNWNFITLVKNEQKVIPRIIGSFLIEAIQEILQSYQCNVSCV